MKYLYLIAALLGVLVLTAQGQINTSNAVTQITTNITQQTALDRAIQALDIGITNYSVNLYATYAPQVPKGDSKLGGGILGLYDFNENAGLGIGVDWLGQVSLVSGDVQLRAPFHISTIFPSINSGPKFAQSIGSTLITPFVLGGVGTPYSGNGHFNGTPMVISDIGGAVEFGHLWGGRFDGGACWGKWIGQGPYGNISRYHLFVGFSKGF
jgi:hypothetical protein